MAEEIKTRREGSRPGLEVLLSFSLATFGFLQLIVLPIMLLFNYFSNMQIPYFIWLFPTIVVGIMLILVIISTLIFTNKGSGLTILLSILTIFAFLQLRMFLFVYSSDIQIPYVFTFLPSIIILGLILISIIVFVLTIGFLRLTSLLLGPILRKRFGEI